MKVACAAISTAAVPLVYRGGMVLNNEPCKRETSCTETQDLIVFDKVNDTVKVR